MQDNVSVLLASILAVIIIVLFPIYNIATRQDNISKNMVVSATTDFVDSVRNKGYIESKDYEDFLTEISYTGNPYEVELEVYNTIYIETNDEVYEEKYEIDYTEDILSGMERLDDSIIKDEVYALHEGDKIYARVKNTNITQAQVLLDRLFKGELTERIVVNYGGIVYSNEWSKAGMAESANTNISISRPMNYDEKEFKYEMITNVYDQYTGEYTTIYGLAVKLDDEVAKGDQIKFKLKYKDIKYFLDKEENQISNTVGAQVTREQNIVEYINTVGFNSYEITAEEIKREANNISNTYDYEYIITLSGISFSYVNNAYLDGMLQVEAGSAETKNGTLGLLNSEEFIIIYNPSVFTEILGPYYPERNTFGFPYKEYEYNANIVTVYDKKNKKNVKIEGIKVGIDDVNNTISFVFNCNNIVGLFDDNGDIIPDGEAYKEARENQVKKHIIRYEDWTYSDILVEEQNYAKDSNISAYDGVYIITISGITYEPTTNIYVETHLELEEKCAKISEYEYSTSLKSKDFIIINEKYIPRISVYDFRDSNNNPFIEENPIKYQIYSPSKTETLYEFNNTQYSNGKNQILEVSGIAVKLTDIDSTKLENKYEKAFYEKYGNQINFRLVFSNITGFLDDDGNKILTTEERENHVKDNIVLNGFSIDEETGNIIVVEKLYYECTNGTECEEDTNGTGYAEYAVTLDNIEYKPFEAPFYRGRIDIKEGCAQIFDYSTIGMSSNEFIIKFISNKHNGINITKNTFVYMNGYYVTR